MFNMYLLPCQQADQASSSTFHLHSAMADHLLPSSRTGIANKEASMANIVSAGARIIALSQDIIWLGNACCGLQWHEHLIVGPRSRRRWHSLTALAIFGASISALLQRKVSRFAYGPQSQQFSTHHLGKMTWPCVTSSTPLWTPIRDEVCPALDL